MAESICSPNRIGPSTRSPFTTAPARHTASASALAKCVSKAAKLGGNVYSRELLQGRRNSRFRHSSATILRMNQPAPLLAFALAAFSASLSAQVTFDRLLHADREPQNWL